ncbi:MAG TPA: hypothetical protein ENK37_02295 [Oceanithermus profundus]|uniref:Uncharacterized protein n=1 Tax=Oceanithermus profundus TaxID=187137 RepID=A0A7C4V5A7_9DEIN|nr:hypothetical protein [Oceanithermus profundus]
MDAKRKDARNRIFVGFMFVGMGIGWLFDQLVPGLFIGMGVGFIVQALLEDRSRERTTGGDRETAPDQTATTARETPTPAGVSEPSRATGAPPDIETVWARITAHQGEVFQLAKGAGFTYEVVGNAVVPSTAKVKIQKSQFAKALEHVPFKKVTDVPDSVFGPSYVYAILMDPRIRDGDW